MGKYDEPEDSNQTIINKLDSIANQLTTLQQGQQKMTIDLTALTAAIAADANVESSAVTVIQNIAAEIQSALANAQSIDANTQVQLNGLATQLQNNSAALAAAIAAANVAAPVVANTAPVANTPSSN